MPRTMERSMNHSIYSIDRVTHLRIVVVAVAAAITMVSIAASSRISSNVDAVAVIKAGKPTAITSATLSLTR
jgi:hypothetical protein